MNKQLVFSTLLSLCFQSAFSQWNYLPNAPHANFAQRFDDIWFVSDSVGWAVNGDGRIYKTTDAGSAWTIQLHNHSFYFRSVEFLNADTGFAGTLEHALFETTDGGTNWHRIDSLFPLPMPGICGIGHWDHTIVGVGIWSYPAALVISHDAGATWTYKDMSAFAAALIDVKMFGVDTIFISGQSTAATGHHAIVLRSTDGGNSWQQTGIGNEQETYGWKLSFPSKMIGYASEEESVGNSSHILKTVDGGETWQELFVTNTNIDMEGIGFANDSTGWLGGWSDGMYATTNGGISWTYNAFGKNFDRFFFLNEFFGYAAGKTIYQYNNSFPTATADVLPDLTMHSLDVFPNPASDDATIHLHLFRNTMVILDIFSADGKRMKSLTHQLMDAGDYVYHWNVSNTAAGIYYAVLRTNEHFLTKQFVVKGRGSK